MVIKTAFILPNHLLFPLGYTILQPLPSVSFIRIFYYGEYFSCGGNKQKVAEEDEDDRR